MPHLFAQLESNLTSTQLTIADPGVGSTTVFGYDLMAITGGGDIGPVATPAQFNLFGLTDVASLTTNEFSLTKFNNSIATSVKANSLGFENSNSRLSFDFVQSPLLQLQVNFNLLVHSGGGSINFMNLDLNSFNVGMGKTLPLGKLHLKQRFGGRKALAIENFDNDFDIWAWEIGNSDIHLYYDANGPTGGENYIDRAQIENTDGSWIPIPNPSFNQNAKSLKNGTLDKVLQFQPCTYRFKRVESDVRKTFGFIAQDIQAVYPELVRQREDDYYSLNYQAFSVVAIKAIQEQQLLFEEQAERLQRAQEERTQLKEDLAALLQRLEQLENGSR